MQITVINKTRHIFQAVVLVGILSGISQPVIAGGLFGDYVGAYPPIRYGYGGYYPRFYSSYYNIPHYRAYVDYQRGHYFKDGRLYHIRGSFQPDERAGKLHFHYEGGWHYH